MLYASDLGEPKNNSLLSSEEQRSSFRAEKAPVIHEAEYKSPPSLRASKKEGFVKKTTISQSVDDTKLPQPEPDLSKMLSLIHI